MCVETMDARSKHVKPSNYLRHTMKPAAKLKWRQLRVFDDEEEDEACRQFRAGAIKGNNRKHQRQAKLAKISQIIIDMGQDERRQPVFEDKRLAVFEACANRDQVRAMAPRNTTQYLMSNVYEDMEPQAAPDSHETPAHVYSDSLSPSRVYKELDSCYESCLAFQQREFEEVFGLC